MSRRPGSADNPAVASTPAIAIVDPAPGSAGRSVPGPSAFPLRRSAGWWLAVLLLLALRIPHFGPQLDDPNSWRQCDTVHNSLDFYRRGLDVLHPAVCWLGAHRTIIMEFPLAQAIAALCYRAFGPDPLWDRLVSFAFYLLATFYLWKSARLVAGVRVAWLTTLAYLAVPLSQFYSRVPHVEFPTIAGSHAMLYYGLRALRNRSWRDAVFAGAFGAMAAVIKAPYLVPVMMPLALVFLAAPGVMSLLLVGVACAIPAAAFLIWRRHVDGVNAAMPDWYFLPGYYKEVNPLWRYMGTLPERLRIDEWTVIVRRLWHQVVSPPGVMLALLALGNRDARGEPATIHGGARLPVSGLAIAGAWSAGALLHVLIFFPLNVEHNYYQIPLLGPVALLIGLGGDVLWRYLPRPGRVPTGAIATLVLIGLAAYVPSSLGYYRIDWLRIEAGRLIEARVPRGELVVASDYGSRHIDPRLLFRSDRDGWPVAIPNLTPPILAKLVDNGARWVAVVTDPSHPELSPPKFLEPARVEQRPIVHDGATLGTLHLYDLGRVFPAASRPRT